AQSLVTHQHSWWFSCFSLREKLARSYNKNTPAICVALTFSTGAIKVFTKPLDSYLSRFLSLPS
ncbi:hypothetical protein, partial [Streptococcus merionis]|uniref:hypothetical protein n=1 Tax=Streptococcus merionis TaxID=400065 RepID=UPI003518CF7B